MTDEFMKGFRPVSEVAPELIAQWESLRQAEKATARAASLRPDELGVLFDAPTPLHFWRRQRGLTLSEIAGQVGVSEKAISKLEDGDGKADRALYERLAATLNVPVKYLVEDYIA